MTLRLKGSNSGDVSIAAPATAGNNTLILPTSNGSANQYLKNGSTAGTLEFGTLPNMVNRTYSTQETIASGDSELEFTGIPADFSRLMIVFQNISYNGSNHLKVEIGHAASGGTYFTSGYLSYFASMGSTSLSGDPQTDSFRVKLGSSSITLFGFMEIIPDKASSPGRLYSFHEAVRQDGNSKRTGVGFSPDISSVTIDRIRLKPSGSNTFDDGAARVSLITEVIQ